MSLSSSCPQYLSLYHAWRDQLDLMRKHAATFQQTAKDEDKQHFETAAKKATQAKKKLEAYI